MITEREERNSRTNIQVGGKRQARKKEEHKGLVHAEMEILGRGMYTYIEGFFV